MNRPVRIGVIGVGAIAQSVYLPLLSRFPGTALCCVMARHRERAESARALYGTAAAADSMEAFLETEPDCAFLLSPPGVHAGQAEALLRAGVHVYCEKPMAYSLTDARRMAEAAEKYAPTLMIGFNRRFTPAYLTARAAFAEARPAFVFAEKNRPTLRRQSTVENGVHMLDLLRFLLGECAHVEARGQFEDAHHELCVTASLSFASGTEALLAVCQGSGAWMERLELHGGGKSVFVNAPDEVRIVENGLTQTHNATVLAGGFSRLEDRFGFRGAVERFLTCMQEGAEPPTNAADALKTQQLLHEVLTKAGLPGLEGEGA